MPRLDAPMAPIFLALVLTTYDPLAELHQTRTQLLTVHDSARDRDIPIKVYLPYKARNLPVILYSHGLGGNRETSRFMGDHWSKRGYVCVFIQHPGSDDSVWTGVKLADRRNSLKRAANGENLMLRVKDVPAVIEQIERWSKDTKSSLYQACDIAKIGMCGHSFGAVTTQAVSGQIFGPKGPMFTDGRIDAAIAFSPSVPRAGNPDRAFGSVKVPWMLMTGTEDKADIVDQTAESRLGVFPALPKTIDRYQLNLFGAQHSVFTDRALPGDTQQRDPKHHPAILALSTAFWDCYLKGDHAAQAWLQGKGARDALDAKDDWKVELKD